MTTASQRPDAVVADARDCNTSKPETWEENTLRLDSALQGGRTRRLLKQLQHNQLSLIYINQRRGALQVTSFLMRSTGGTHAGDHLHLHRQHNRPHKKPSSSIRTLKRAQQKGPRIMRHQTPRRDEKHPRRKQPRALLQVFEQILKLLDCLVQMTSKQGRGRKEFNTKIKQLCSRSSQGQRSEKPVALPTMRVGGGPRARPLPARR